jgi:hypothetical protein
MTVLATTTFVVEDRSEADINLPISIHSVKAYAGHPEELMEMP